MTARVLLPSASASVIVAPPVIATTPELSSGSISPSTASSPDRPPAVKSTAPFGQEQAGGDLAVGGAECYQAQDVDLPSHSDIRTSIRTTSGARAMALSTASWGGDLVAAQRADGAARVL